MIGPDRARLLLGTELTLRSGQEKVPARVEDVEFGTSGLFITLQIDEDMPRGMAALVSADGEGIWMRVASYDPGPGGSAS